MEVVRRSVPLQKGAPGQALRVVAARGTWPVADTQCSEKTEAFLQLTRYAR